jgi:hypothetical protein
MEPESSLPCSQQPAASPYPKPDESSPHLPTLFWYHPPIYAFRVHLKLQFERNIFLSLLVRQLNIFPLLKKGTELIIRESQTICT